MDRALRQLTPRMRPLADALLQLARNLGGNPTVTSVYRSPRKQARLYRAYMRGESPYPAQPPGKSMHEHRIAFDVGGLSPGLLARLGREWESVGGTWGGRFKDPIHFDARVLLKSRR